MYSAGNWNLTKTMKSILKTLQLKIYRRILGTFRLPLEGREEYYRRTARLARYEMLRINAQPWDELAEKLRWQWLGHCARGRGYPKLMLTEVNALTTRNLTTDLTTRYRSDWILRAQNRADWQVDFEAYLRGCPDARPLLRSIIGTRSQISRATEISLMQAAPHA